MPCTVPCFIIMDSINPITVNLYNRLYYNILTPEVVAGHWKQNWPQSSRWTQSAGCIQWPHGRDHGISNQLIILIQYDSLWFTHFYHVTIAYNNHLIVGYFFIFFTMFPASKFRNSSSSLSPTSGSHALMWPTPTETPEQWAAESRTTGPPYAWRASRGPGGKPAFGIGTATFVGKFRHVILTWMTLMLSI